jgi:hypothetical protein
LAGARADAGLILLKRKVEAFSVAARRIRCFRRAPDIFLYLIEIYIFF